MKLNEIDFDKLSDNELVQLCLKYKIIDKENIQKTTRKELLIIIREFIKKKLRHSYFAYSETSSNGNIANTRY